MLTRRKFLWIVISILIYLIITQVVAWLGNWFVYLSGHHSFATWCWCEVWIVFHLFLLVILSEKFPQIEAWIDKQIDYFEAKRRGLN